MERHGQSLTSDAMQADQMYACLLEMYNFKKKTGDFHWSANRLSIFRFICSVSGFAFNSALLLRS